MTAASFTTLTHAEPAFQGTDYWIAAILILLSTPMPSLAQQWPIHSLDRPRPPVVDPGPGSPSAAPPRDAIVLFDGTSLAEWQGADSGAARWRVQDGYMEVVGGTGSIRTRRAFGDIQLHLEWAAPAPARGEGQERGNSGVFLMGHYEVQVLDSYQNLTYADGQAAALYGQMPPLVNACRPPGEWQTYDIVFRRPLFGSDGRVTRPARISVFHNGVLVQDAVEFAGRTAHARAARYEPHADRLPLGLQDHGDPVRFRNIWIRELPEHD